MKNHLFVIDPQNDFCDPKGSLYVPGADQDMDRLGMWVRQNSGEITNITITADSHLPWAIFHPIFWRNLAGENPEPFSTITAKEVSDGVWQPTIPGLYAKAYKYLTDLEGAGKSHTIWPLHCLIGSWGWATHPALMSAIVIWSLIREDNYVCEVKGSHPLTEHYSIFQAAVPDPRDPRTQINSNLIAALTKADRLIVAGEALNFCVLNSINDLIANIPTQFYQRIVVLEDCTSPVPVPGYDSVVKDFYNDLRAKGITITTTDSFTL